VLADFQQALADLTAMPEWCLAVRADAAVLHSRYTLTEREARRLHAIAADEGMSCACTVYRMNRLAPLAMNVRLTLRALGPDARDVLSAYWREHPRGHSHFFLESDRFCRWLRQRIDTGLLAGDAVRHVLARENEAIEASISASCTEHEEAQALSCRARLCAASTSSTTRWRSSSSGSIRDGSCAFTDRR
jgi:hypothetical protein